MEGCREREEKKEGGRLSLPVLGYLFPWKCTVKIMLSEDIQIVNVVKEVFRIKLGFLFFFCSSSSSSGAKILIYTLGTFLLYIFSQSL